MAALEKFSRRKGGEIYKCFAQFRLVFQGKPQAYRIDEYKIAYALSYLTGATQNWAMPILQALVEGCHHDLLMNYDSFRKVMIAVYGDLDRRDNVENKL